MDEIVMVLAGYFMWLLGGAVVAGILWVLLWVLVLTIDAILSLFSKGKR